MNNLNHTDHHDVDEDVRTIAGYGGRWPAGNTAGVFERYSDSHDQATYIVASRQKIIYLLPRRKEV